MTYSNPKRLETWVRIENGGHVTMRYVIAVLPHGTHSQKSVLTTVDGQRHIVDTPLKTLEKELGFDGSS